MQDIVCRLLEEAVRAECGEETVDAVFDATCLERPSSTGRSCNGKQLGPLFEAAAPHMVGTREQVEQRIGRQAALELRFEYPSFFMEHGSVLAFLVSWDSYIHPEIERLFPEARFPKLSVRHVRTDGLDLDYASEQGLCRVAEGLVQGIGDLYEQMVRTEQTTCRRRGEPRCRIRLSVGPAHAGHPVREDVSPVQP